ncbi:MAG: iron-containing alcohol dehydrogenase [Kaiparowitsia implicata GSE-PSE-MK54-09C]|jgi:alcohol dehydrogenase class IV|nr:iron-containing alcohol dehydrogenase [Kaiparowitsia implicata GSE-PSE-MK54-09C]
MLTAEPTQATRLHTYSFPTAIVFGAGARWQLSGAVAQVGMQRPLVVSDRAVAQLPWFKPILESLAALPVASFSEVWGNPVGSQVKAGLAAYRDHQADGIVAIGGGAPMDVAKAIALMAHHPGHLFEYEDGNPNGRPVNQPIPPIVAIPTTAGTGSEVGRSAVISDDETHAKKIMFDPRLLPQQVLADPELLLGLPAAITAATGMDALTHLIEAYLAQGFHPLCDGIALEGMRLVAAHLSDCVAFAERLAAGESFSAEAAAAHLTARGGMLNASMMGAIAFQKGLGVTHSCAHALSTVCDTHHGLANAVMLPAAMRFNLPAAPERFLQMARVVMPEATRGEQFIDWIIALGDRIGIPPSLTALDVPSESIDRLVDVALHDECHLLNPHPVSSADFGAIYRDAFGAGVAA